MALDARKRQQKLAKKAAKRKAVLATKKPVGSAGSMVPHGRHAMPAASAPIHECLVPDSLFDIGIGNVIVSRKMPNGFVGAAFFLVDVFCLGIKDAFYEALSPVEYDYRVSGLSMKRSGRSIPPVPASSWRGLKRMPSTWVFPLIQTTNAPGRFLATSTPRSVRHTMCLAGMASLFLCLAPMTRRPDAEESSTRSPGAVDLRGSTSRWLEVHR